MKIQEENYELLRLLSKYLNDAADSITPEDIREIVQLGVSEEYAYSILLASIIGLDLNKKQDEAFFEDYFSYMIHKLDVKEYADNPYYKNIKIPTVKFGRCDLKYETYKPYEAFVADDFIIGKNDIIIPQIGFFDKEFSYPAILQDDRIWMTTIPNEINTMKQPIETAKGKVLTYGLGLGYYVYMVSEKPEVESITVVEKDTEIILMFERYLLPQFNHKEKIKIIADDAFHYAQNNMSKENFNLVFTDLWHDVSDGIELYKKMKSFEMLCPNTKFMYWIEKSMRCYM